MIYKFYAKNGNLFQRRYYESILGFPRIGKKMRVKKSTRELLEWKCSSQELETVAKSLRAKHWEIQKGLDYVCVNDLGLYDNVFR